MKFDEHVCGGGTKEYLDAPLPASTPPTESTFNADGTVSGGISSRTIVPSSPLNGGPFSFSGWVKNEDPTRNWNRVFDLGTASANDNVYLYFDGTSGKMGYKVWHGASNVGVITTTAVFPTDQWVYVELIHRANTTAELYWDHALQVSGPIPLPLVTGRTWYVGKGHWPSDVDFQGAMKEIHFYNDFNHLKTFGSSNVC